MWTAIDAPSAPTYSLEYMKLISLVLILGTSFFWSPASLANFRAGASAVEIKAPPGISLAGYFQRIKLPWMKAGNNAYFRASVGQHDPLRIKALVFQLNDQKIAILSADLVAPPPSVREYLIGQLQKRGLNFKDVFVVATHTHSSLGGFVHQTFWERMAADKWIPEVSDHLNQISLQAILEADEKMQPARLSVGQHLLNGLSINRRGENNLDPVLTLLRFENLSGQAIGQLINFPVHGDLLPPSNLFLSSDVPGEIERQFESFGGVSLFLSGAAGDIDPTGVPRTFEGLATYGKRFAEEIPQILSNQPMAKVPTRISVATEKAELPAPTLNLGSCLSMIAHRPVRWNVSLPKSFAQPLEVVGLKIDQDAFVFIPGEPFAELGLGFKSYGMKQGLKSVSVVGLANTYLGYIMSEEKYWGGGYEPCNSFYGPNYSNYVVQGVEQVLNHLTEKN